MMTPSLPLTVLLLLGEVQYRISHLVVGGIGRITISFLKFNEALM